MIQIDSQSSKIIAEVICYSKTGVLIEVKPFTFLNLKMEMRLWKRNHMDMVHPKPMLWYQFTCLQHRLNPNRN